MLQVYLNCQLNLTRFRDSLQYNVYHNILRSIEVSTASTQIRMAQAQRQPANFWLKFSYYLATPFASWYIHQDPSISITTRCL